jgi:HEAT repeat protein
MTIDTELVRRIAERNKITEDAARKLLTSMELGGQIEVKRFNKAAKARRDLNLDAIVIVAEKAGLDDEEAFRLIRRILKDRHYQVVLHSPTTARRRILRAHGSDSSTSVRAISSGFETKRSRH